MAKCYEKVSDFYENIAKVNKYVVSFLFLYICSRFILYFCVRYSVSHQQKFFLHFFSLTYNYHVINH